MQQNWRDNLHAIFPMSSCLCNLKRQALVRKGLQKSSASTRSVCHDLRQIIPFHPALNFFAHKAGLFSNTCLISLFIQPLDCLFTHSLNICNFLTPSKNFNYTHTENWLLNGQLVKTTVLVLETWCSHHLTANNHHKLLFCLNMSLELTLVHCLIY